MIKNIKYIFFIGIGGVGMSSLAQFCIYKNYHVSGYDINDNFFCKKIRKKYKISIINEDNPNYIDKKFKNKSYIDKTLIVYTSAINTNTNKIFKYYEVNKFKLIKRAQLLGILSKDMFLIAISGTHGKTTTASILTYILNYNGYKCTSILGGIMTNYNNNFIIGSSNILIVEADEYDKSFLSLNPNIIVITSIRFDHSDIYNNIDDVYNAFNSFIKRIRSGGIVVKKYDINIDYYSEIKYGILHHNIVSNIDILGYNIIFNNNNIIFSFSAFGKKIDNIKYQMLGFHNINNVLSAISVALYLGINFVQIKNALIYFKGVKNRFDIILQNNNITLISDYAHHHDAIKEVILTAKNNYTNKLITVIFQPHLYSRTLYFAFLIAKSLDLAYRIILTDIYPARECNYYNITSNIIYQYIKSNNKHFIPLLKNLPEFLLKFNDIEILIVIGAGNIHSVIPILKKKFSNKYGI